MVTRSDAGYTENATSGNPLVECGRHADFGLPRFLHLAREALAILDLRGAHDILDIGCGNGLFDILYAPWARSLTLVEPCAAQLELARINMAPIHGPIHFVQAEAWALPFEDGSFDRIALFSVLPLISSDEVTPTFREMRRVAKPGARILLGDFQAMQHDADALMAWWRGHGAVCRELPASSGHWQRHIAVQLPEAA